MALAVRELDGAAARRHHSQLAAILVDAVERGASVSFLHPFSLDDSLAFWNGVIEKLRRGDLFLLGAFEGDDLVGTAQLHVRLPPNQPHRAEVAKVLVHSQARRQGVARRLMEELERVAVREGRWLLVLDTVTGSPAEGLYRGLGYQLVGVIPDYAMMPDGTLTSTSVFYKRLAARGSR